MTKEMKRNQSNLSCRIQKTIISTGMVNTFGRNPKSRKKKSNCKTIKITSSRGLVLTWWSDFWSGTTRYGSHKKELKTYC
jgi:hypothetical protein